MFMESSSALRLQEPAALNITARINAALDTLDLGLQRAKSPIVTTKFGPQSAVLLHLVTLVRRDIPVIWINTGYNTPSTPKFVETVANRLDLNLHEFGPSKPWAGAIPDQDPSQMDAFSEHVKLEPFRRALSFFEPDIWVTALRREQTEFRSHLSLFQKGENDILKICPVLDWRDLDMEAYLSLNQLPSEADYFDPTKKKPHLECGLHNRL
ncbi:MAG: phosphoadenosine phosphosulfate reductase family protein [Pseudomonadota bacterium]